MPIHLDKEYPLGKWNYYSDKTNSSPKIISDSIYVFKPWDTRIDHNLKYQHTVYDYAVNTKPIQEILI